MFKGLDAVVARHSGGVDRGLEVGRRDRRPDIEASATFDRAVRRGEIGQIALHNLGPELAQALGPPLILPRRTRARTLCPLASSIAVRWRPMAPMSPAALVTRIGLPSADLVVMSLAPRLRSSRLGGVRSSGGTGDENNVSILAVRRGRCSADERRDYGSLTALSSSTAARTASAFAVRSWTGDAGVRSIRRLSSSGRL